MIRLNRGNLVFVVYKWFVRWHGNERHKNEIKTKTGRNQLDNNLGNNVNICMMEKENHVKNFVDFAELLVAAVLRV